MREELVQVLRESGVYTLREQGIEDAFIAGDADLRLDALQMDSLALMEFCIALETRWGFSVAPDELADVGTLGQLADRLEAGDAG
jgi:acyl carrier protein